MLLTPKLSLNKPEASDPVDIDDINDNMDTLDTAVSGKVTSAGGDISNTVITTLDTITTQFPVPTGGETAKTFLGKVRKFIQDFNDFKTGILTVGQLVNNAATNNASLPVSAAVAYLLQTQITTMGTEIDDLNSDLTERTPVADLRAIADVGIYSRRIVQCNGATLNTPYSAGLTKASSGTAYINMSSPNHGTILYVDSAGPQAYLGYKNSAGWQGWVPLVATAQIKYSNGWIAMQSGTETTLYRLQLQNNGNLDIIKSTDGGVTWPVRKTIATGSDL